MTKKRFRQPLRPEWAEALLSGQTQLQEPEYPDTTSVATLLASAQKLQQLALDEARVAVKAHPLMPLVAQAAANEAHKRGHATIVVDDDGTLMLEVAKGKAAEGQGLTRKWETALPSLQELREKAAEMGVDISDLGRSKKKIVQRLADRTPPKRKRTKTAPALTKPRIVPFPPQTEVGDLSLPDKPQVDMDALAGASEDIDSILAGLDD